MYTVAFKIMGMCVCDGDVCVAFVLFYICSDLFVAINIVQKYCALPIYAWFVYYFFLIIVHIIIIID